MRSARVATMGVQHLIFSTCSVILYSWVTAVFFLSFCWWRRAFKWQRPRSPPPFLHVRTPPNPSSPSPGGWRLIRREGPDWREELYRMRRRCDNLEDVYSQRWRRWMFKSSCCFLRKISGTKFQYFFEIRLAHLHRVGRVKSAPQGPPKMKSGLMRDNGATTIPSKQE